MEGTALASPWTRTVTLGSATLALVSHLVGGTDTERITGVLVAVALVGSVYLLYRWGQHRDSAPEDGEDGDGRRRQEMKAEAGGYGGNGGGM